MMSVRRDREGDVGPAVLVVGGHEIRGLEGAPDEQRGAVDRAGIVQHQRVVAERLGGRDEAGQVDRVAEGEAANGDAAELAGAGGGAAGYQPLRAAIELQRAEIGERRAQVGQCPRTGLRGELQYAVAGDSAAERRTGIDDEAAGARDATAEYDRRVAGGVRVDRAGIGQGGSAEQEDRNRTTGDRSGIDDSAGSRNSDRRSIGGQDAAARLVGDGSACRLIDAVNAARNGTTVDDDAGHPSDLNTDDAGSDAAACRIGDRGAGVGVNVDAIVPT